MTLATLTGSRPWWVAGWTMVHFFWIGAALWIAAVATRRAFRRARPEARYCLALVSLTVLALNPVAIASLVEASALPGVPRDLGTAELSESLEPSVSPLPDRSPAIAGSAERPIPDQPTSGRPAPETEFSRFPAAIAAWLPWLWLAGAPATFTLLATGLVGAERLRRQSRLLTEGPLFELCQSLGSALRLTRPVALGIGERLATPIVLGVVRPMILLPPAALTGWSPELIELALLHELAHVRRHDILVNLIQRVVESILFFHPAVWIMSSWVREEREHCCDRLVVDRTGRPAAYAEALVSLSVLASESRVTTMAMARNHLVVRIRRILDPEDLSMKLPRSTLALFAVPFLIPALLIGAQVATPGPQERGQPDPAGLQQRNEPAQAKLPGRIVAHAFRMGAQDNKEERAGVTGVIEIDPESGNWWLIAEHRGMARLSPDGQTVAFLTQERSEQDRAIWTASVRGANHPVRIADLKGLPIWSPDGKQIIVSVRGPIAPTRYQTWRMDADGSNRTTLPIPESSQVEDWSANGQLLVTRWEVGKRTIGMIRPDGTEERKLDINGLYPRLSPDGRKIVITSQSPRGGGELTVLDIERGTQRQINVGEKVLPRACWSPDGRWLAVSLIDLQKSENGRWVMTADFVQMNCRIEIMDLDGKRRRRLDLPSGYVIPGDWR